MGVALAIEGRRLIFIMRKAKSLCATKYLQ